ncbi:DUF4199 family protein [Spirosoma linguale]|uniref:DUF4199 domain-containing protein n=1 Tax=Spirosoma linguale (strain ATCC 33905 / DSM 74 / LMG 10896 / Claus 1) TaxID=504472 RepID=D2QRX6_SPILD|nr:hypothetical protein Slin_5593 [Spirosoma linguale DSM 74]
MSARFAPTVLLLASLYTVTIIFLQTAAYIAEQTHTSLPNFGLLSVSLTWGSVVVGFHQFAKPILSSIEKTILAVVGVVLLGGVLITGFDFVLHYYIDPDYKNRLAIQQLETSQQKMRAMEAEKNVIFNDDDELEMVQRFTRFYSVKGLIQTNIIGGLISSVLLCFIVLLSSSSSERLQE